MNQENKKSNPSYSPVYRSKIKNMIERAASLHPLGIVTPAQKKSIKYFAERLTEDFSKRRSNDTRPEVETNETPTDSVKY